MDCYSCRDTQRRGEAFNCGDCGFASNGPRGDGVMAYHRSGVVRGPAPKREWEMTLQEKRSVFGSKLAAARDSTGASIDARALLEEGESLLRKYQTDAPTETVIITGLEKSVTALQGAVSANCNLRSEFYREANASHVCASLASKSDK